MVAEGQEEGCRDKEGVIMKAIEKEWEDEGETAAVKKEAPVEVERLHYYYSSYPSLWPVFFSMWSEIGTCQPGKIYCRMSKKN
mmetsp:Transcript_20803/g.51029  ORF Transcript_20803/g.51029 Transcript_20803/m.51029 type:complete len:83 (-) Transcript_20803:590-838(-)